MDAIAKLFIWSWLVAKYQSIFSFDKILTQFSLHCREKPHSEIFSTFVSKFLRNFERFAVDGSWYKFSESVGMQKLHLEPTICQWLGVHMSLGMDVCMLVKLYRIQTKSNTLTLHVSFDAKCRMNWLKSHSCWNDDQLWIWLGQVPMWIVKCDRAITSWMLKRHGIEQVNKRMAPSWICYRI